MRWVLVAASGISFPDEVSNPSILLREPGALTTGPPGKSLALWFSTTCETGRLLLERKAMTNLDNVLKGRDVTLLTKVHIVKAMVFLVVHG